ncbi:MAG: endonuclease/exonuclease/phosphatase family protein [Pseudomonadota bacterium]
MRVVTYNILCGGRCPGEVKDRLGDILVVLEALQPDILALQEANRFERPGTAQRFGEALRLPQRALSRGAPYKDGERYHVALFSRFPLTQVYDFPGAVFQSAALAATIDSPLGALSFCTLHLHSYKENKRLKELAQVLAYQKGRPNQILLGDFNALSQCDGIVTRCPTIEGRFDVTDRLTRDYVDVFDQEGFVRKPSFPSRLPAAHLCPVPRRIDYLFAERCLAEKTIRAEVIESERAHAASDHLPLVVDFAA